MSNAPKAVQETIFGPFIDEEFFYYNDHSILGLVSLRLYREGQGYIGFEDLEPIYALGKDGQLDDVFFSGIVTLTKTKCLSSNGFAILLGQVREKAATVNPQVLRKWCKDENIKVELFCQLKNMPVCYLVRARMDSIMIVSNNKINKHAQRRYWVESFHIACFERSESVLRRYMVLAFIFGTITRNRKTVSREERDVHWLVQQYMDDYDRIFPNRLKPTLHRSEVYDHFAIHSSWLKNIFDTSWDWVNKAKWTDWVEQAEKLKESASDGNKWGKPIKRVPVETDAQAEEDEEDDVLHVPDLPDPDAEVESESEFELSSCSSEDDSLEDEPNHFIHHSVDMSVLHKGLFKEMSPPTFLWLCDITAKCKFRIDLHACREQDLPCMKTLSSHEKEHLRSGKWHLAEKKLARIWIKMCQSHMDWHWKEVGLKVDHDLRTVISSTSESLDDPQAPDDILVKEEDV
ncbi:hypothetical protein M422DRAFT_30021 [Sphaerobolus stellatus SS14]|uniref:Unplaced genomic scaffold SPHSTscaffold_38, whole genome shotgun sequence n=1 Tax=Sphaerobolus stellatus (strain SS14) TaxID=990650 RepID=A0A0C9W2D2_SPHS4|nr:hypothetical protein M422DRAFT_30021 [Sphaerobolus stellatus SS14]